jgi:hypothetical protein
MESPEAISDLRDLLGKSVLVGITYLDDNDQVISQYQFHGRIESLDDDMVHVRVASSGEDFTLPPDPSAFIRAKPGNYRLRSSGDVVVDPDFTSVWTVSAPDPDQHPNDEGLGKLA